ncbi:MAG: hypothetical protein J0I98_02545 [Mesorhizobium sp.]|nr:hypothetical protein [Mesorhizobium sp.]MBN9241653.1 hypothetical protein [Mesorhizobium sp.]MBN9273599.1 hypothetical protein [Mesorhizobium sp.]ODU55166.1 MAG: hypothetical protein ABS99_07960 [Acetobacteraceae bacterium SCN 69-10]
MLSAPGSAGASHVVTLPVVLHFRSTGAEHRPAVQAGAGGKPAALAAVAEDCAAEGAGGGANGWDWIGCGSAGAMGEASTDGCKTGADADE